MYLAASASRLKQSECRKIHTCTRTQHTCTHTSAHKANVMRRYVCRFEVCVCVCVCVNITSNNTHRTPTQHTRTHPHTNDILTHSSYKRHTHIHLDVGGSCIEQMSNATHPHRDATFSHTHVYTQTTYSHTRPHTNNMLTHACTHKQHTHTYIPLTKHTPHIPGCEWLSHQPNVE